jgi:hypothetical protein
MHRLKPLLNTAEMAENRLTFRRDSVINEGANCSMPLRRVFRHLVGQTGVNLGRMRPPIGLPAFPHHFVFILVTECNSTNALQIARHLQCNDVLHF